MADNYVVRLLGEMRRPRVVSEDISMPVSSPTAHPMRTLFGMLPEFHGEYSGLILASMTLSGIEGVLHPLLLKEIFDQGVVRHNFHRFVTLALLYLCFGLLVNLLGTATSLWTKSFENRVVKALMPRLLTAYYRGEYSDVLAKGQGYFINRVLGDIREGVVPLLGFIQSTISQIVLLMASILVLLYLSWRACVILAVFIPLSAGLGTLLRRRVRELTTKEREQDGSVLSYLSKVLGAFRMIREFDLLDRTIKGMNGHLEDYLATVYKRYRVLRLFQGFNDSVMVISDFLALFVGALFVLKGALSFGAYLAFINTFWRTVTALVQLLSRVADYHSLSAIVTRLIDFISISANVYYGDGASASAQRLKFSYKNLAVLESFSLQIAPGEKVLVMGPNGSGKTTLVNILSGYLAPSEGTVILPQKISSIALPILFPPLKIRDLPIDTSLLAAFDLANEGVLEAMADELSAGQQQKLAIALALTQEAELYIFDEPLACLDEKSKKTALHLLFSRTKGKALVLIMHEASAAGRELFDSVVHVTPAV